MTSFQIIEDSGVNTREEWQKIDYAIQTQGKKICGSSENEISTGTGSTTFLEVTKERRRLVTTLGTSLLTLAEIKTTDS